MFCVLFIFQTRSNEPKRKIFADAVDLIGGGEPEMSGVNCVEMLDIDAIKPFRHHPFHMYEGERFNDMVESIKEHGILTLVIVRKMHYGYEMLAGHNRQNAAKLAGLKEIPAIVKENLPDDEAYVYVIETNLMQRSFLIYQFLRRQRYWQNDMTKYFISEKGMKSLLNLRNWKVVLTKVDMMSTFQKIEIRWAMNMDCPKGMLPGL